MIRTLRWLLFIPVAGIATMLLRIFWSDFPVSYALSGNSLRDLLPLVASFAGRGISVAIFMSVGALVAPKVGAVQIALLGLFSGLYSWPFGAIYEIMPHRLYICELVSTISAVAMGMMIAFHLSRIANETSHGNGGNGGPRKPGA